MCKALKFPRSTYYKALVHVPLNRELEYRKFSEEVKQCFHENKKRYGAIKIHRKLTYKGFPCSVKRVQRHMQRQDLHSVVVKKYNHKANQGKLVICLSATCRIMVLFIPLAEKEIHMIMHVLSHSIQ